MERTEPEGLAGAGQRTGGRLVGLSQGQREATGKPKGGGAVAIFAPLRTDRFGDRLCPLTLALANVAEARVALPQQGQGLWTPHLLCP